MEQENTPLENERNEMIKTIEWSIEYHTNQLEKFKLQLQVIKQNCVNSQSQTA